MISKLLRAANRLRMRRLLARNHVTGEAAPYSAWNLPRINNNGHMRLGRGVRFEAGVQPAQLSVSDTGRLNIGDGVFINVGVDIFCTDTITIGAGTLIATGVRIFDTGFHAMGEGEPVRVAPVTIGRNVWLAHGCVILPGVEIGDHAVIGANSVVTKSIPPRTFAAGVPAVRVRELEATDSFIRT